MPDGSVDWLLSAGTAATVGTHATLALECYAFSAATDFVVQIDDAYAGPDLTMPVTLQGFTVE